MSNQITESWDFKEEETQYLTHTFHSYPARFIPQIPQRTINLFTNKNDTILDPFCGCGTTCVESRLLHRNAIGIDLNPLSTLITKAKSVPIEKNKIFPSTKRLLNEIKNNIKSNLPELPSHLINPKDFEYKKNQQFYIKYIKEGIKENKINPRFFKILTLILNTINENFDNSLKDYFKVAFSSTINTLSRNAINESIDYPIDVFRNRLYSMNEQMKKFNERINDLNYTKVYCDLSWNLSKLIETNSIDHIITSPPYANAFDYHREHKMNILWLGLPYRPFKNKEMGAHSLFTPNRFRMLTEYLADMFRTINQMSLVLKEGKKAVIVIGNSTVEHIVLESHKFFEKFGGESGLYLKNEILRNIDATKKYTSNGIGNINTEYVMIFEKKKYNDVFIQDIISTIETILKDILYKTKNDKIKYDANTLAKTIVRENNKNIKDVIKNRNATKLQEAIDNIKNDANIYN